MKELSPKSSRFFFYLFYLELTRSRLGLDLVDLTESIPVILGLDRFDRVEAVSVWSKIGTQSDSCLGLVVAPA